MIFRLRSPALMARHAHRFVPGWTIATLRPETEQDEHPYRTGHRRPGMRVLVLRHPPLGRSVVERLINVLSITTFCVAHLAFTSFVITGGYPFVTAARQSDRAIIMIPWTLVVACVWVSSLFSTTTLTIDPAGVLVLEHGPLAFCRRNLTAPVSAVRELRVVEVRGKRLSYRVVALLDGGESRILVRGLTNNLHATHMARVIALRLGHIIRVPRARPARGASR